MGNGKFIKDKVNYLSYNIWSCGDYTKNLNGIAKINDGLNVELSDEYSYNGDYCFKYTSNLNQYQGTTFNIISLPNNTTHVKLTLTAIKILNGGIDVRINENNDFITLTVPANNNPQTITLETEITTNTVQITLIFRKSNVVAYIDNICLIAQ